MCCLEIVFSSEIQLLKHGRQRNYVAIKYDQWPADLTLEVALSYSQRADRNKC